MCTSSESSSGEEIWREEGREGETKSEGEGNIHVHNT